MGRAASEPGEPMTNNDVLRSIRKMLDINSATFAEILALDNMQISRAEINNFLQSDEHPDYILCPDGIMASFLDGLIFYLRGKDETRPSMPKELPITNNLVMKKLRVAFQLKEEDMLEIFKSVDFRFSKSELSAILRKRGHDNYRPAGDQVLRNFLKGLTLKLDQKT